MTILLLGSDQRPERDDDLCTDAIIVLSVDPGRKTGLMISVPRDIYVHIPDTGVSARVNSAFRIGEESGLGGGSLVIKTVSTLLDIHIDHFVLINFDVFTKVMDAIGPIRVSPRQPIYDDQFPDYNYGVMTISFPAGPQLLSSVEALQYARVRHKAGDDFGRAMRHQEIIRAVRERLMRPDVILRLILRAGQLWQSIRAGITTDMVLLDWVRFMLSSIVVPPRNIFFGVPTVRRGQLRPIATVAGEQVLVPVENELQDMARLFFEAEQDDAAS